MSSKNRYRRARNRSKAKLKEGDESFDNQLLLEENDNELDSIPFQRLESPRPPSPFNSENIASSATGTGTGDECSTKIDNPNGGHGNDDDDSGSIDNDEPEPFASLEDTTFFDSDCEGDLGSLRPSSQNSIASVIKHSSSVLKYSIKEAKHMMHLCGVGVGANNANEFAFADGEIPDMYKNDLPKFYSTGTMPPFNDSMSIPSRTNTTSSSSLSSHFGKHGLKNIDHNQIKKPSTLPSKNNEKININEKSVPFPQSIYSSANNNNNNPTLKKVEAQVPIVTNKHSIPLRHSQSAPFQNVQHLTMRRSASTPATFNIGKGRSAFGKVDGNSIRNRASTYSSPSKNGKSLQAKCLSDNLYKPRSESMRDLTSALSTSFNSISITTPAKRWVSRAGGGQEAVKEVEKKQNPIDNENNSSSAQTNSGDVSSLVGKYSKSKIMNSKTQRKIKERRKERRKLQKEHETAKSQSDSTSQYPCADDSIEETEQADPSNGKISTIDKKENVSYLNLDAEIERIAFPQDFQKIDDPALIEYTTDFSDKIVSKSNPRNIESPPIPPTFYQKIVDEDQPSPSFNNTNPPIPPTHNRRPSKISFSQIDRVGTPPLNNYNQPQLVSPQRIRGSVSPCSRDSASHSRNSRSVQSLNTSSQTISTFISGNASCNRSVTSSVAEADREVRDTNRRELKRREGVDLDGSMSIQSSDTISTNAYLALTSSPAQLRDGANIHHDRFFGCNSSVGAMNSQSSNASSLGLSYNQNHLQYSPGMNGRNTTSMNVRSPMTVSSSSIANNTNSSNSTSEDPPQFVSLSSKGVPINSNRGDMPPRSDQYDSSVAYTKLGSSDGRCKSRSSSGSSSSKSTKSKSSKSKSSGKKKKDKPWLYHKIGSAKVADHHGRASTPSPCNSHLASPVKTPITPPNQFDYPSELVDVQKPRVRRHLPVGNVIPGSKMVLVSPGENDRRREPIARPVATFWPPPNGRDHRAFQPTLIRETVVTPEKSTQEKIL